MLQHELAFAAMGTDVRLATVGGDPSAVDLSAARRLIADCERRWSRFLPDSELSALNAAAGRTTAVAPDTFSLLAAAVEAWHLTAGRFDPTVLPALVAAGYDRSFEHQASGCAPSGAPVHRPPVPPGCAGIVLVPGAHLVRLPAGVALDLGGIAKGHTADLATLELMEAGAAGAMADLGGDVRVCGSPPEGDAWLIAVDDPHHPGSDLAVLGLADGAVATSSRMGRRWGRDGHRHHHLIDPATGEPADGDVDAAIVVAGGAAWAEVLAKAALVAGAAAGSELVRGFGATGLLCLADGSVRLLDGMEAFLR